MGEPTAQARVAEAAATPDRSFEPGSGLGLGTCFHALPFQCIIRDLAQLQIDPTAQALVAEVAATAFRPATVGLACRFQAVPFQCKVRLLLPTNPTAQALLAEVAVTRQIGRCRRPGLASVAASRPCRSSAR